MNGKDYNEMIEIEEGEIPDPPWPFGRDLCYEIVDGVVRLVERNP
jgi:hypothetical protein